MKIDKFLIVAVSLFIVSCSGKTSTETGGASNSEEELITISKQQFETNKMEVSKPIETTWYESVKCKGIVEAMPGGIAQAGSMLTGVVQDVLCAEGDYVQQGKKLCTVTCLEWIELQKNYAETYTRFKQAETEYNRIAALYDKGVGSEKELMAYRSEFQSTMAARNALKMKLIMMNVSPEQTEAGNIAQTFSIKAPISGYIAKMKAVRGQTIEVNNAPFEIINPDKLHLKLMLFENEAGKINLNQDVEFRILSKPDEIIKASIYKIGKSIDNETKSVISFAWIDKNVQARLINNTFVDAEIKTDIRTITALPTEAVVKTSIGNFVLVLEKLDAKNYYFRKEKIETGLSSETFIEVKTGLVNKNVLTKGAFNLIVE
jgi:cobalt-zinc-cadmium efflux system membrane fusion protein